MSGLRAARSYTSVSGTSSAVGSAVSTSGSALSFVSYRVDQFRIGTRISQVFDNLTGLRDYQISGNRRPGDVFFHVYGGGAGHTNMTAPDVSQKIDAVDPYGVRIVEMSKDKHQWLVYRFHDQKTAAKAARLAKDWAQKVGYSDVGIRGTGITARSLGAVFGSCKFGLGAQARLMKYTAREGQAPKNVICSEMIVLAYQLSISEKDEDFPRLDAKYTLPSDLMKYFDGAGRRYWERYAYKLDEKPSK